MPKTIAITPSWFWPESIRRVAGIPPYRVPELCVSRHARDQADATAIITVDGQISYAELQQRVNDVSTALPATQDQLSGELNIENIITLLAALAAGRHCRIGKPPSGGIGAGIPPETPACADVGPGRTLPTPEILGLPALSLCYEDRIVRHSHRSLLANAISLVTFLQPLPARPWLASLPLDRWEGLLSVLVPLYLGAPLALSSGDTAFADSVMLLQPSYAIHDLQSAAVSTREDKRAVKKARSILDAMLLTTDGVFNPGDRQRVSKSYRCSALTFFGLPETGIIFASHPQWYIDESIGIPVTNAHVVPADPRSGTPIQTLWELVESAEVTVKGPMLMCRDNTADSNHFLADGRFRTGVIASSDANGMIYILPD